MISLGRRMVWAKSAHGAKASSSSRRKFGASSRTRSPGPGHELRPSWLEWCVLTAPRTVAITAFLAATVLGAAVTQAQQILPYSLNSLLIPSQTSADSVSNFVFSTPSRGIYSLTIKTGATAGYLMLFDATSLPANGAVASCTSIATARPCLMYCIPVAASSGLGIQWMSPLYVTSGVVAGYSTTGCDSLTASATAKFMGQAL